MLRTRMKYSASGPPCVSRKTYALPRSQIAGGAHFANVSTVTSVPLPCASRTRRTSSAPFVSFGSFVSVWTLGAAIAAIATATVTAAARNGVSGRIDRPMRRSRRIVTRAPPGRAT